MRIDEIASGVNIESYAEVGIDFEDARKFLRYKLSADDAAFYCRIYGGVEGALKEIERERLKGIIRRAKERAITKLPSALPLVRDSGGSLGYRTACALIADDDEVFDFLCLWTLNAEDAVDQRPEAAARFLSYLRRIRPIHKKLYRGQRSFHPNDDHQRGFHSWTTTTEIAQQFAERDGVVLMMDGPLQGVALEDVVTWRMRLRQNESHYSGFQAEWFVVDQPEGVRTIAA